MTLMLLFLNTIAYAVIGMIFCLWVDGFAEAATDRYIGSHAGRSVIVWLTWPVSLPLLVLLAQRLRQRESREFVDLRPRRPLTLVDGS